MIHFLYWKLQGSVNGIQEILSGEIEWDLAGTDSA